MTSLMINRLMAPVAMLSILLLILAFASAWYLRNLQRTVSEMMTNNVESVRGAQELEISIREIRTQFDRYLITLDKSHLESVPRIRQRASDAMANVERTATTPQEQALIKRTRQGYDHFFAQYEEVLMNPNQSIYTQIIKLIDSVLTKEILDPAHEYLRLNEGMLTENTRANRDMATRLTTGMIALGLCGSIGGLLAGTVITMALRRSLQRAEQRLHTTAEQLDQAVHPGRNAAAEKKSDAIERMSLSATAVLQRLKQTEKDVLRAEQLAWVGQIAAGIAHEIRNPLMAIKLIVQAAAERRVASGFREKDFEVLDEEIIRVEQIVSGFLDFARPARSEPRPVDIKELAERTVDGIRTRAELQGVDIHIEPATGPTVVSADPNQVRQVLYNLLFNALDAQPQGGHINLRVYLQRATDGSPEVLLSVEDRGPGLPSELGDRVFEPFVSTKETGLGLGLSISKRIAESHGGNLSASNASSGGAIFILRLPVIRSNPIAERQPIQF